MPAWAEAERPPKRPQVTLERTPEGLYLSGRMPLELTAAVEDVLYKGVPLHFVWQAEVVRSRWYWMDERVTQQTRVVRVVYQPLTRRWRLSVGAGLPSENGGFNALNQNVDTLADALAVVARVTNWRLLDTARLEAGSDYRLEFRFYLDTGLLPRPFQIGIQTQSDWNIGYEQVLPVPTAPTTTPVGLEGDSARWTVVGG